MSLHLLGGAVILTAAVYALGTEHRRRRARQTLLWSLTEALSYMEMAIRWQNQPLSAIFQTLQEREECGAYFKTIRDGMESDIPLQALWHSAFCNFTDRETADILCRVELSGDGERLCAALTLAQEELVRLHRRYGENDRQQSRVTGAAMLSGACLLIILLL